MAQTAPKPCEDDSDEISDQLLLECVSEGDKSAFETLYRRYYPRIFQFVYQLTRKPETTREVVSDVILAIWQGAHHFEGRSQLSSWILGIALRQTHKTLQGEQRHNCEDLDNIDCDIQADTSPNVDSESSCFSDYTVQEIQNGLRQLSSDHQAILSMTAQGYSCAEIAEIIGCPHITVRPRMFYARRQLKEFLNQRETNTLRPPSEQALWLKRH